MCMGTQSRLIKAFAALGVLGMQAMTAQPVHSRWLSASDVPELPDGVVGVVDRLAALLAHDAHPDLRGLNHGHIVGAVADGQHLALRGRQSSCFRSQDFRKQTQGHILHEAVSAP